MAKNFIVETSARHVHVTQEHLETLFGKGYELTKKKDLSQPGQFACEERVTVVGPKKELAGVSTRRDPGVPPPSPASRGSRHPPPHCERTRVVCQPAPA